MARHSFTRERAKDRQELIYMYRQEIKQFIKAKPGYHPGPECLAWVDQVIRKALPYNCKTNSIDIWLPIEREYNRMAIKKLIQ